MALNDALDQIDLVGTFREFLTALFFLIYDLRQGTQKKNKQTGLHHTKKFLHRKETINKMKRQPTKSENILTKDISHKGLILKTYKEFMELTTKKPNNPLKKLARDMNRHFPKRGHTDYQQTYEKMLNFTNQERNAN